MWQKQGIETTVRRVASFQDAWKERKCFQPDGDAGFKPVFLNLQYTHP
jgi:hypothetical protein